MNISSMGNHPQRFFRTQRILIVSTKASCYETTPPPKLGHLVALKSLSVVVHRHPAVYSNKSILEPLLTTLHTLHSSDSMSGPTRVLQHITIAFNVASPRDLSGSVGTITDTNRTHPSPSGAPREEDWQRLEQLLQTLPPAFPTLSTIAIEVRPIYGKLLETEVSHRSGWIGPG